MKKIYEKPQIMFESFTLSTNIAGDCEVKTWTPTQGGCPYKIDTGFGVKYVFTTEIEGCTTVQDDGVYNGICYHVPSADNNLFGS